MHRSATGAKSPCEGYTEQNNTKSNFHGAARNQAGSGSEQHHEKCCLVPAIEPLRDGHVILRDDLWTAL